jgi:hypothetical protein
MVLPFLAMGLGILGGALLGDNGNTVTNEYEENIKQAISSTMESEVNASANAICNNTIEIKDSKCCTFNIGPQSCQASAVNEVISKARFQSDITQKLLSSLTQSIDSSVSGIPLGKNEVNNIVKKNMDVAIQTKQAFSTDCSKNAMGNNLQSFIGTYCGMNPDGTCQVKDKNEADITTAAQSISVSAIGSCAAETVGSSSVAQEVASLTEQIAVAKNTGIDFMGIILTIFGPLILLILLPTAIRMVKGLQEAAGESQEQKMAEKAYKKAKMYVIVLVVLVVAVVLVLWPLGFSILSGFWPHSPFPLRFEAEILCDLTTGTTKPENRVVNDFMWFDKNCVTSDATECTVLEQMKVYDTCGIGARETVCKDSALEKDKKRFENISNACEDLQLLAQDKEASCDIATLTKYTMPSSVPLGACRRCDLDEDPKDLFGLFATIDKDKRENDADCSIETLTALQKKNEALPAKCFRPCQRLAKESYFAAGFDIVDGKEIPKVCSRNDNNCISRADYERRFPNECTDTAYMENKRAFVTLQNSCKKINLFANTVSTTEGETVLLSKQCPPKPFDYFNCDKKTFECKYTASNANDEDEVNACRNSFETCQDELYLTDKKAQDELDAKCAIKKQQVEKYEKERLIFAYVFASILGLLVLALIAALFNLLMKKMDT